MALQWPLRATESRLSTRQRGVLIAAGVANAPIFLDQTVVVVALPSIQRDFHSSAVEVKWTIGAYLLSLAALVASSGRLADLYGRRRLFVWGLVTFGMASAACALAPSQGVLIIARVAQGVGAALTQPLVLAHATAAVPEERRGWAIGVVASAGTSFLILGPILGGVLVDAFGWRSIFFVNVPVVLLAVMLAARFIPESRAANPPRLDVRGVLLLSAGLAAIVAGLLHMQTWATPIDLGVLAAGGCLLGAFVAVEERSQHPLLPLGLLRRPRVFGSIAALVSIQASVLGVTVYLVLFLQNGVRVTATAAGGVLVVAGMWSPLLSRLTGRIADHKGARRLISSGLIAAAIGLLGVALAAPAKDVLVILPGLLVFGISRPFVFTPASTGPIKALPSSERGLASSLVAESRQIGAVLGVAALGSITAAFELHSTAGASAAGFQAAMLTAAVTSLAAGLLVLVAEPKGA